jgi:hypothetical protein
LKCATGGDKIINERKVISLNHAAIAVEKITSERRVIPLNHVLNIIHTFGSKIQNICSTVIPYAPLHLQEVPGSNVSMRP